MSHLITASSATDAFLQLVYVLNQHPDYVTAPRGLETRECIGVLVKLRNPFDRIVGVTSRHISLRYLIGEWLWYERASNSLQEISYYSKFWNDISDDGVTANSAYGYRIFGRHPLIGINQWECIRQQLLHDRDSRRAVVTIRMGTDLDLKSNDVPCTISLQFIIRDHRLHLLTNMRSNDLILGFVYDLACFTLFQEKMLCELQVHDSSLEMGEYFHFVSSLHVYRRHDQMIDNILAMPEDVALCMMPRMRNITEISRLQVNEAILRTKSGQPLLPLEDEFCRWCMDALR